ncbi:isoleucine--tRNA ligase [Longibacter salinarum]|uniref:Isoleucine--tRNA ligase n=1 Tax=Longibacter salinarum TaxID=1850348 RepID=A0A2A8CYK0_9BACT|nr:isoleucine--tRNA ligase [Longibacter salinarum]PEN13458.1 isoleucine--tRNA ligase [Longibacter salinarum]
MATFDSLPSSLPQLEESVLDWWTEHSIFEKSISERDGQPAFTFYEGPPTANGHPGIHHVMARAIKDIFCRYKTMKGFRVARKAGWDTHGLPVEIEVEKELGLNSRADVEEYGVEKYNAACRESVLKYKDEWDELTQRMGYWVDLDDPYVTYETEYIESVWWLLKQIHDSDLLYRGKKVQWYSPGSHTVLSSHEVSLGYEETQDPSVYIRFAVDGEEDTYFLAWTTTPWTLISNTALAVGSDIEYAKVRHDDPHQGEEFLIMATELLDEVLDEDYEIVDTFPGSDLLGKTYQPVFSYFTDEVEKGEAWRVVSAGIVSTEEGTGLVHMAPAYGADDHAVAQSEGLPLFNPIDTDGRFTDDAPLVAGEWFKDADKQITTDLKERGLLYKHETYLHNYPFDWRKGTPLMSYPVDSWFIRTTALKDKMVERNKTINWQPEGIGIGRFGEWLENNVDWALSRRRYWGTPLPIWVNDQNPDDYFMVGSIDELRERFGDQIPADDDEVDLHRPFVDDWTCEADDGGTYRRVPDLIDVWFDSGSMPYAQWHYPFENKEEFEANFPADFIAEGVDQTRGWFYTLHAIATLVMDDVAYKNVVVNGLVLDEDGNKMSKSKGNTVAPFEVIDEYGADVVRWYMMSNTPPWENIKFSERGLRDLRRKFFGTLENVYSFFSTYANIDEFDAGAERIPVAERPELDRWIISRLNTTVEDVAAALDEYDPTTAARAVEGFVEEMSNWYLRRSRRRFWSAKRDGGAQENGQAVPAENKEAAYQTVYECLLATAKLMSPVAPFFGEKLYRVLTGNADAQSGHIPESVHLADFPVVNDEERDDALEHRMGLARTISSVVLSLRNQAEINVRQPLPRILVVTGTGVEKEAVDDVADVILDEVNVKEIQYVDHTSDVVRRSAKPNFSRLGPRLGAKMKPVNQKVRQLDDDAITEYIDTGSIVLTVDGDEIELGPQDLDITSEGIEGWLVEQRAGITVALDTQISEALLEEGLARESVKRIQNLRKDAGFDVTDRIEIDYRGSDRIRGAITQWADWIRNETLALELQPSEQPEGEAVETFEIGDEQLTVAVRRASTPSSTS